MDLSFPLTLSLSPRRANSTSGDNGRSRVIITPQAWAALQNDEAGERTKALLAACSTLRGECTRLLHAVRASAGMETPAASARAAAERSPVG